MPTMSGHTLPRAETLRLASVAAAGLLVAPAQTAGAAHPLPDEAWAVMYHVNQARHGAGLQVLDPHPCLLRAAQDYALTMATTGCFDHECPNPDGTLADLVARVRAAGYREATWCLGECLAANWPDGPTVVDGWVNQSPPHRAIVLQPGAHQIGAGVVRGGPGPFTSLYVLLVAGHRVSGGREPIR